MSKIARPLLILALGRRKAWKQALLFWEHSRYAYPLPIQSLCTGRHKPSINSHNSRQALCIAAGGGDGNQKVPVQGLMNLRSIAVQWICSAA